MGERAEYILISAALYGETAGRSSPAVLVISLDVDSRMQDAGDRSSQPADNEEEARGSEQSCLVQMSLNVCQHYVNVI